MISSSSRLQAQRGFTLIELLVVILIMALLIAVALPAFLNQTERALDSKAQQELTASWQAAEQSAEGYANETAVAKQITLAEPELSARVVASPRALEAADAQIIGVSTASTREKLVLLTRSKSGNVLRLEANAGAKPVFTTVGEKPVLSTPTDWGKIGYVAGGAAIVVVLLVVFLLAGTSIARRRSVRRLTSAQVTEWARYMSEPGYTGPVMPEEGYEVLVPEKRQSLGEVAGRQRVDIHFIVALYRWQSGAWTKVDDEVTAQDLLHVTNRPSQKRNLRDRVFGSRGKSAYPTQLEFREVEALDRVWPAETETVELVEAWCDFTERVATQNRMTWARMWESRIEDELRQQELQSQLDIAELLPGTTNYDELAAALKERQPQKA